MPAHLCAQSAPNGSKSGKKTCVHPLSWTPFVKKWGRRWKGGVNGEGCLFSHRTLSRLDRALQGVPSRAPYPRLIGEKREKRVPLSCVTRSRINAEARGAKGGDLFCNPAFASPVNIGGGEGEWTGVPYPVTTG